MNEPLRRVLHDWNFRINFCIWISDYVIVYFATKEVTMPCISRSVFVQTLLILRWLTGCTGFNYQKVTCFSIILVIIMPVRSYQDGLDNKSTMERINLIEYYLPCVYLININHSMLKRKYSLHFIIVLTRYSIDDVCMMLFIADT